MTEVTIDNSKLPGVKEVCRDFAVLEDHSLAHSLQEQEIEHHLATNVQRNRLVKHDLQVAKQLQEEEDLRAQVQTKHHHNKLELLDGEIAQEIQEKLVIEAERKRLQEEKDEDIARILQEKEEKRRKKHYPPRSSEEPYYAEGHHKGRRKEYISEYDRPHRHERSERKERGAPKSERSSYYEEDDRKRGRSAEPRSNPRDHSNSQRHENHISKASAKRERPERPPPPRKSKHEDYDNLSENEMYPTENLPRRGRSQSQDLNTKHSGTREHQESSCSRAHKRGTGGDHEYERHRRRTPSPQDERQYRESGHRSKGHRESPQAKPGTGVKHRDTRDAAIARRLQEEELRVNAEDYRAAQLAQDEELARWLMEKEQQSYKKSKGREKMSDRKRPDEWEVNSHEHGRPRSRDEQHCSRSDKPYRPLPPAPDEDHSNDYSHDYMNRNPHGSPRSGSKSQSSNKSSYSRQ